MPSHVFTCSTTGWKFGCVLKVAVLIPAQKWCGLSLHLYTSVPLQKLSQAWHVLPPGTVLRSPPVGSTAPCRCHTFTKKARAERLELRSNGCQKAGPMPLIVVEPTCCRCTPLDRSEVERESENGFMLLMFALLWIFMVAGQCWLGNTIEDEKIEMDLVDVAGLT